MMQFMFNVNMVLDVLRQILEASDRILKRFEPILNVDDFTDTPEGMEKLDAICMPIIAIGEHQIKPLSDTIKKIIEDLI